MATTAFLVSDLCLGLKGYFENIVPDDADAVGGFYYEELPTTLPVLRNRLHELRRLEHARGNIAFQISFRRIPLDLGSPHLPGGRTLRGVACLLVGGKAD